MEKPADFLQDVWDKLTDAEKKEIYLENIITEQTAPQYLAGLIRGAEIPIDDKISIAEKIIKGVELTAAEKEAVGLDIAD